jgi:hypothetical protein
LPFLFLFVSLMASTVSIVTPEDLQRLEERLTQQFEERYERKLAADRAFLSEFLKSQDDQVSARKALEISGIKSRTTLIAERKRPGSPLSYTVTGRSVSYSRAGCIAYKLGHQLAA